MTGILTGVVKGIEANRQNDIEQQRINLAKSGQQLQANQQQFNQSQTQRENRRQDLKDKLDATGEEITGILGGTKDAQRVISGVPDDPGGIPPTDPAAAKQWQAAKDARSSYLNGDLYKSATDAIKAAHPQLEEAYGRHRALLGQMAGEYAGEVNDDAQKVPFLLQQGGLDAVSPRQYLNYRIGTDKLPPEGFLHGPNGEPSQYSQAANRLVNGLQNGKLDGLEADASLIMPELHMALGQQMPNGNTVTGAQATHMFVDPNDPGYVHVSSVLRHEGPAGTGYAGTPHMADGGLRYPIKDLVGRLQKFVGSVQEMDDPQAQAKLKEGLETGDSAMHDMLRIGAEAGVPPQPLVPVKRGESLVDPTTGKTVVKGQQYVPGAEAIFEQTKQDLIDSGMDPAEADQTALARLHPSKYQPGAGGGAPAGDDGGGKVKAVDRREAQQSAIDNWAEQYGAHREKGQWVNADGEPIKDDKFMSGLQSIRSKALKARTQDDLSNLTPEDAGSGGNAPAPTQNKAPPEAIAYLYAHPEMAPQFKAKYGYVPAGGPAFRPAQSTPPPAIGPRQAAAAVASPKPAVAAAAPADQGAAIRKLAEPVNYSDYVSTGPSGAARNIDADLHAAEGALTQLQASMGDQALPENVRADMQHRFAAELMRKNELLAVKQKMAGA